MNYETILQHAFTIVRRHRAFWVLGFIWAIAGGTGGGYNWFQYTVGGNGGPGGATGNAGGATLDPGAIAAVVVPLLIAACCLVLVLIVVSTIVRYVVMVGTMRSLDHLDRFGIEPTVRGAWSEGWNARTWRPFLQNLVVGMPLAILAVLSLGLVAAPLLLAVLGEESAIAAAFVGMACMFCLWILALIAVSTVIGVLRELWWRAAVLDDQDFVTAMADSIQLARANVGQLAMTWVVMFVVGLVWFAITIALGVALGLLTAVVAGLPALLLYQATDAWVLPVLVGVPLALLTFGVPMTIAQGLYLVFHASVWNQVYRQLPHRGAAGLPDGPLGAGLGSAAGSSTASM